ncbi:MAG: hypothetical protein AAF936_08945 [Pseudomonadota bacterium]
MPKFKKAFSKPQVKTDDAMTHRRRLLKAALLAPAAALSPANAVSLPRGGGDARLFALYADWLTYDGEMQASLNALERAEKAATARGVSWDDCPAVRAVLARQAAFWDAQRSAVTAIAATRAARLDGVALKLALWRRANPEASSGQFTDNADMLAFSAHDDMIALTGRTDLAHEGDETLRAEIENLVAER